MFYIIEHNRTERLFLKYTQYIRSLNFWFYILQKELATKKDYVTISFKP